ncbi:hypothetical protein BHE74_00003211 [Ensete ventricosum]|nr:hypothetical protein BHE74_00003211 [Ensete ventricosum]
MRKVKFRSVFHAPSQKFKILIIPNVLANRKSYKHGFMKKCDGHKLCIASKVGFRSVFHAPSQKFKILAIPNVLAHAQKFYILAIPNVLAHRKLYEHHFMKKCDGQKLYAKTSFDRFIMHHLENSKYWPFPMY